MKKFFIAFKILPKGIYRLNIACSFIIPLIIAFVGAIEIENYHPEEPFFGLLLWGIPIYWILARIAVWVYAGFIDDKK